MKKLRLLALMDEALVPPDDVEGVDVATVDWKTEFDVVSTLRELGHEVQCLGVGSDLAVVRKAVGELQPHAVFNLLEDFHDVPIYDQNVVSYLELLRVPYTGCNPRGLMLARDKAISKKLLTFHRLPVPEFAVFRMGRAVRRPGKLSYPLIVKSLTKEGSAGIAQTSIVHDDEKLAERVAFIHKRLGTDAIAERFIHGRELYVGILGNARLQCFPIWELLFTNMPDEAPRIATQKVKWDAAYQKKHGIMSDVAKGLPADQVTRITQICKRIYRILELSGYARIDLRLDTEGRVYVLEANPNPQLAYGEDFAESAERAGLDYDALIQRIVNLALQRVPDGMK
ncbi:MAG TPA: D-alanine--D-alanine ligase [Candidatus Binatia bacterium]|jgi:D-alanine-D-alanine ligase|nr:D-alanine--D-alanine ligase [Candidatus Binatia bacterium]